MSQETQIVLNQAEKEALLSERELQAYKIYMRLNQPPMAQSVQKQFFALFIQGSDCEDIFRLNPNGFSFGAIVRARVENDWDAKLQNHQASLQAKMRTRVQQVTLETVDRLVLELAASNQIVADKIKRYLMSGDEAHLEGTGVGSLKHLAAVVTILQTLTGQDVKKVGGSIEHHHTVAPAATTVEATVIPAAGKPLPAESAAQALAAIHKARQGGQ